VREVTVEGPGLVGFGDGELIGAAPFTACLTPGILPIFVPPGA
jgi:diacylglycerol kinase (ATP)